MITRPGQVNKYNPSPLRELAEQTFIELNQHLIRIVHNIRQDIQTQYPLVHQESLEKLITTKLLTYDLSKVANSKVFNPSNLGDLSDLNNLWLHSSSFIPRKDGINLFFFYLNLNDIRLKKMNDILLYANLYILPEELEKLENYSHGKFQVPAEIWTKKSQTTLNVLRQLASKFGTSTTNINILNDYDGDKLLDYFPRDCLEHSINHQQWEFFEFFYPTCEKYVRTQEKKFLYITEFCMNNKLQLCKLLIKDITIQFLYYEWRKDRFSKILRILQTEHQEIIIWVLSLLSKHMIQDQRLVDDLNNLTWQIFSWALAYDKIELYKTTIIKNLYPQIDWNKQITNAIQPTLAINLLSEDINVHSVLNPLYIKIIAIYLSPLLDQTQKLQQLKLFSTEELYTLQTHALAVGNLKLFWVVYTILDHEQQIHLLKYNKSKLVTLLAEYGHLNYLQQVFKAFKKKDILSLIEADNWDMLRRTGQNKHWPIIDYLTLWLSNEQKLTWLICSDNYSYFIKSVKTKQLDLSWYIWSKLLEAQKISVIKFNASAIITDAAKLEDLTLFKSMLETWLNNSPQDNLDEKRQFIAAVLLANNLTAIQLAWIYILPESEILTRDLLYLNVQQNNSNSIEWLWHKSNPAIHELVLNATNHPEIIKAIQNENLSILKLFFAKIFPNDKIKMLKANNCKILSALLQSCNVYLLEFFCENIKLNTIADNFNINVNQLSMKRHVQFIKTIFKFFDFEHHTELLERILINLFDKNLYASYPYFYFLQWTIHQSDSNLLKRTITSSLTDIPVPFFELALSLKPELDEGLIHAEKLYLNHDFKAAKKIFQKYIDSKNFSKFALGRFCTIVYSNKKETCLKKYEKHFQKAYDYGILNDEITEAFNRMLYLQNTIVNPIALRYNLSRGADKKRSCSAEYCAHLITTHFNTLPSYSLEVLRYYTIAITAKLAQPDQSNSSALNNLYIYRALAYLRFNNLDMALLDLQSAISINPNQANAYAYISMVYILRNDFQTAINYINYALTLEPNNPLAIFYRLKIWLNLQNYHDAAQDLATLKQLEPHNRIVYFYQAIFNWEKLNFAQALEDFDQSIKLQNLHGNHLNLLKYCDNISVINMRQQFFENLKALLLKQPDIIANFKISPSAIYEFFHYLQQAFHKSKFVQDECATINFKTILNHETIINLLDYLMQPESNVEVFEFICWLNVFDKKLLKPKLFEIITCPTDKYHQIIQYLNTIFDHEELYSYNKRKVGENSSRKLFKGIFVINNNHPQMPHNNTILNFKCTHPHGILKPNTITPTKEVDFRFIYDLGQLYFILTPKTEKNRSWVNYFKEKLNYYQSDNGAKLSDYIQIIRHGNSDRYDIISKSPAVKLDLSQPLIISTLQILLATPSPNLKKNCSTISFTIVNKIINNLLANEINANSDINTSFSM